MYTMTRETSPLTGGTNTRKDGGKRPQWPNLKVVGGRDVTTAEPPKWKLPEATSPDGADGANSGGGVTLLAQTKGTRDIIDQIEHEVLKEKTKYPGATEIQKYVDAVIDVLALLPVWPVPVEVYAGCEWEVGIVWEGSKGSVEISSEVTGVVSCLQSLDEGGKEREEAINVMDKDARAKLQKIFGDAGIAWETG